MMKPRTGKVTDPSIIAILFLVLLLPFDLCQVLHTDLSDDILIKNYYLALKPLQAIMF